jgi:hypothetical protein
VGLVNVDTSTVLGLAQQLAVLLPQDFIPALHELQLRFPRIDWIRLVSGLSALGSSDSKNRLKTVSRLSDWSIQNASAANGQATANQPAAAAGVRHVLTALCFTEVGTALGGAVGVNVRDGLTGVGALLWTGQLICPANDCRILAMSGLSIVGSAATQMTVEFSGGGGANVFESVSASGFDIASADLLP